MADLQQLSSLKPDHILEIILRRKWLILIPLCLSLTIGIIKTLTTSTTYEASTLILVQPQRVPTGYIKSVVTSDINQRISTISQQILSSTNLQKIIDQFGIYENAENMYHEDKISGMRRRVKVKIERARRGAEAFTVGFTGKEPQKVMMIANTLASFFMDENLKVREAQAVGTSEFLESELEKIRKKLEDRERKLTEYRAKHLGGLPDELESNLRALDRLQIQLTDKNLALRETKKQIKLFAAQSSQFNDFNTLNLDDEFETMEFSEEEEKIANIQKQYNALLLKYTDKHPDVRKLRGVIAKLEKKIADENESETDKTAEPETGEPVAMQQSPMKNQLNPELKNLKDEIKYIKERMLVYQKRVEDTPKREQQLNALNRDYNNIKKVFNSLLDRRLEAEIAVNMEKKQKGEQFRILDHARLPEKPISPNIKMLFMLSIAVGLGFGGGVTFLLEIFDNSIRREDQIENDLDLPILASIPPLKKPGDAMKKKIEIIGFSFLSLYAALFLTFFTIINEKGIDKTINFIKMNIITF